MVWHEYVVFHSIVSFFFPCSPLFFCLLLLFLLAIKLLHETKNEIHNTVFSSYLSYAVLYAVTYINGLKYTLQRLTIEEEKKMGKLFKNWIMYKMKRIHFIFVEKKGKKHPHPVAPLRLCASVPYTISSVFNE